MKLIQVALTLLSIFAKGVTSNEDVIASLEKKTLDQVYRGVPKPEAATDPQYWVVGKAFVTTDTKGEHYFWMQHTIYTPPINEI